MDRLLRYEFHVASEARERYRFEEELFSWNGNVLFANVAASRRFAEKMNQQRDVERHPERTIHPGALNAKALIDALAWFERRVGAEALDRTLLAFTEHFPPQEVFGEKQSPADWLRGK